jgi:hypothetical protein
VHTATVAKILNDCDDLGTRGNSNPYIIFNFTRQSELAPVVMWVTIGDEEPKKYDMQDIHPVYKTRIEAPDFTRVSSISARQKQHMLQNR